MKEVLKFFVHFFASCWEIRLFIPFINLDNCLNSLIYLINLQIRPSNYVQIVKLIFISVPQMFENYLISIDPGWLFLLTTWITALKLIWLTALYSLDQFLISNSRGNLKYKCKVNSGVKAIDSTFLLLVLDLLRFWNLLISWVFERHLL